MAEIDEKILQALNEEERSLLQQQSNEMSLFENIGETFKGKRWQLNVIAFVFSFIAFFIMIYCGVQYFSTDILSEQVGWMGGVVICVVATGNLKIWFWMEMNRASVSRDLKRLELQISLLSQRM